MTTAEYPSEILIESWIDPPPCARAHVPGSKSLTNRALIVAALAQGSSLLRGALDCEDTQVMVAALRTIGVDVKHDSADSVIAVRGCSGVVPAHQASLVVANSGTSLRFLTAMLSTGHG